MAACRCEGKVPLARFCEDDLYCPQCGAAVAELGYRANLVPSPPRPSPELWVYPDESGGAADFRFTLSFRSMDPLRRLVPRPLELTAATCHGALRDYFLAEGEVSPNPSMAESRDVRLRPRDALPAGWQLNLPPDGVEGELRLRGSCGSRTIRVRAFSPPAWDVQIQGEDSEVIPDPGWEHREGTWKLSMTGPQSLTVQLAPANAQAYLLATDPLMMPAPKFLDGPNVVVRGWPTFGAPIGPGAPAEYVLRVDTTDWGENVKAVLTLAMPLVALDEVRFDLKFSRKALGNLRFDCGQEYTIDEPLFYGERFDSMADPPPPLLPPVVLINYGEQPVRVSRPVVKHQSQSGGAPWLEVGWGPGDDEPPEVFLNTGEKLPIRLVVDLRGVTPDAVPPGSGLVGKVEVRDLDSTLTRTLTVRLTHVRHRAELGTPLAIDFGNTNTLAAVIERRGLRTVLGGPGDAFPTAIFVGARPDDPRFVAGPKALDLGAEDPSRLVRGLKRELSTARDGDPPQYVYDAPDGQGDVRYRYQDLIGRFLELVIEESEARLRQRVRTVGLSYPANFSPRARRRLDAILREMEGRRPADSPIDFLELATDEATAVALSFVLDVERLKGRISEHFPDPATRPESFLVAAFDFGGGSIDCALIRFQLTGSLDAPAYTSEPLGIGGDEHFGGDNVTAAVYELMLGRVTKALAAAKPRPPVTLPVARADRKRRDVTTTEWENFHHLWEAAERAKWFACLSGPSDVDRRRFDDALVGALGKLRVSSGKPLPKRLTEHPELIGHLTDAIRRGEFLVPPDEIYRHTLGCDLAGNSGYTVEARVLRCVDVLKGYVEASGRPDARPDFIVMAGGGCHLPLACEALKEAFGGVELLLDLARAKSQVAFGLSRYLDLRQEHADDVEDLKPASDYSHARLLWQRGKLAPTVVWVPTCSPLNGDIWYELPDRTLAEVWTNDRKVRLLRETAPEPETVGHFDLLGPTEPAGPGIEAALPPDLVVKRQDGGRVALRFLGSEDRLLLRVLDLKGRSYGDWPLIPRADA